MQNKKIIWFVGFTALFVILGVVFYAYFQNSKTIKEKLEPLLCKVSPAQNYPPVPSARIINFPENEAVGSLYTATGIQSYSFDVNWREFSSEAKDEIRFAEGTAVFLEIKEGFSSFISELESNSLQAIDFSAPIDLPFELYTDNQTKRIVQLSDEDLEPIGNLNGLYQLILHNTTITNKALFYISKIKSLRLLNLWNTQITDEGLVHLAQLPLLDTIYLGATNISDSGLEHLNKLTQLRCLWLTGSNRKKGNKIATASSVNLKITDAGVHHLNTLRSLEYLVVANTNITDESISILSKLTFLRRLDVSGTMMTEKGIKKLQAALPECRIINDTGMIER